MARLKSVTFDLASATGVEVNMSGSPTIVTSPVFSGSRSLALNQTAVSGIIPFVYNSDQNRIGYVGFALYVAALPSATASICVVRNAATGNLSRINLGTTGIVSLRDSSNVQPTGSATYTIATGRWYWIELKHDATTNPGSLSLRVSDADFNLLFSTSGANNVQGSWNNVRVGNGTTLTSEFYIDNVIINDDTGSNENTWVGPQKLLCLRPNAAGDFNQFKNTANAAGGPTNYTLVNEIPPDDSTTFVQSGTLDDTDMYAFDDGGLGAHDIIRAVSVNARLSDNSAADATLAGKVQLIKASGGTVQQSAAIIPNTTTWLTDNAPGSAYQAPFITAYTDPDGQPWTSSTIDSLQAGLKITAAGTQRLRMSAMWVIVSYIKQGAIAGALLAVI